MILRSCLRAALVVGAFCAAFMWGAPNPALAGHPHGGGGTALMLFDGPIYAGHNNGFAEGPVGTLATFELRYMNQPPANWVVGGNADLWLYRVQNEAAGDHTCSGTPGAIHIGAMPSLSSSGGSTLNFIWPAAANDSAGPDFGACVHQSGAPAAYEFSTDLDSFQYFRVLTHAPATLSVSPTVVHRGDTITVTGSNWGPIFSDVPGSAIQMAIGHCNSGNSLGSHTVTTATNGNFSTTFTIPVSAAYGSGVQACAASDYQHIDNLSGASQTPPTFQIVPLASPTGTIVPPTVTVVATGTTGPNSTTPTPVATPGHGGGGGPCSSGMGVLMSVFLSFIFVSRRRANQLLQAKEPANKAQHE